MSSKWIFAAVMSGLIAGGTGCWALAPADEKPVSKTPSPVHPLPPAKPPAPSKPQATAKSTLATPPAAPATELSSPMPVSSIDRALAKKVSLDLTNAPFNDFVAAIKTQTGLEITVAPGALTPKADEKSTEKVTPAPEKSSEKPADKSKDKAPDKTNVKPAEKAPAAKAPPGKTPTDKANKPADTAPEKAAPEKPALDKSAAKSVEPSTAEGDDKDTGSPELVVSVHLKGITAQSALNLVLRDVGLTWGVDRGGILITQPDQLPPVTAVYDIRDLVVAHPSFDNHDDSVELDYDPLINLITGVIQCPGWAGDVDKIQDCNPFHGTLTVRQDQQVQQKVAGLLAALRKSRDLPTSQYSRSANLGIGIVGADDSAIEAALDANVEVNFTAVKLDQVADYVRNTFGIPVHIDSTVPESIEDNQPFTIHASNVPLRSMLKGLLPQGKLAFAVTDETLVITSQDAVADLRSVRVYPVGDLFEGEVDQNGIDDRYAELLDSITRNIDPSSWAALDRSKPSNTGGNAYAAYLPAGKALVVDQTSAAHEEIADTLAKLRAAVARQPAIRPAVGEKTEAGGSKRQYLSMRIYKLNQDLPAEDFVAVVHDLVEPKSWNGEAYIHGVPGAIVVRQTPAIHKRIERLLIDLGAIPDPKKGGQSGQPILIGHKKRI